MVLQVYLGWSDCSLEAQPIHRAELLSLTQVVKQSPIISRAMRLRDGTLLTGRDCAYAQLKWVYSVSLEIEPSADDVPQHTSRKNKRLAADTIA